ncbi:transposase is4 [Holotrichia oblita]|uniref:Transposase is4 n=1 Tax=Holotrichia oblita TaxID=644536 RepID=A0ACB9SQG8_HOLOL|nr:transposase is4 [Holotrichia oblita]
MGLQVFLIAGVSGYILDFIPYQGVNTFDELKDSHNEISEKECDLSVRAGIVIALCKSVPHPYKATAFFDFSGLPLFLYLRDQMGIYSLGTIRNNRVSRCPIETDKVLKKQGRGKYDYKIDNEKGIIIVKWMDELLGNTLYGV